MVPSAVVTTMASRNTMNEATAASASTQALVVSWFDSFISMLHQACGEANGVRRSPRREDEREKGKDSEESFRWGRILWPVPNVFSARDRSEWSKDMKRTVVRYKTKPEQADENARLIEKT